MAIRRDLLANSLLSEKFIQYPNLLSCVHNTMDKPNYVPLTDAKGRQYLDANWEKYEKMIIDLLTLKPFEGRCELSGENYLLKMRIKTPSVIVIKIG